MRSEFVSVCNLTHAAHNALHAWIANYPNKDRLHELMERGGLVPAGVIADFVWDWGKPPGERKFSHIGVGARIVSELSMYAWVGIQEPPRHKRSPRKSPYKKICDDVTGLTLTARAWKCIGRADCERTRESILEAVTSGRLWRTSDCGPKTLREICRALGVRVAVARQETNPE